MIKYTALTKFTASIENNHRQFVRGDIYESEEIHPELESYISFGFVSKEEIETPKKEEKKQVKK